MDKVYIVLHESNSNSEFFTDVVPCADFNTAKSVMADMVNLILTDGYKFSGLDLDSIEKEQDDEGADCGYVLERRDDFFHIETTYDDYYEDIQIIEKEIVWRENISI